MIEGGGGRDLLAGRGGDDVLLGGGGTDDADGGGGTDVCDAETEVACESGPSSQPTTFGATGAFPASPALAPGPGGDYHPEREDSRAGRFRWRS